MASRLSELDLFTIAKRFVTPQSASTAQYVNHLVKEALNAAEGELCDCDSLSPLAWRINPWSGIRTRCPASISAVTQASPGVVTAQSDDGDVSGHGLLTNDIVRISQVEGMEELNDRYFLVVKIDATTMSLKSLDGLLAIDTTNYTEYDGGGGIYHCGVVLDTSSILSGVESTWGLRRILPEPTFDGRPARLMSELEAAERGLLAPGLSGRPMAWRHWENTTDPNTPTTAHYFFWYPAAADAYNLEFSYEREVPSFTHWDDSHYPQHPAHAHDALWHGALAFMGGNIERAKRSPTEASFVGQVEILAAQQWMRQWSEDKRRVIRESRRMLGKSGGSGGFSA